MSRAAVELEEVEYAPWGAFLREFTVLWGQGEHLTVIGPTGRGKSVLALALVKARVERRQAHAIVCATKPRDRTLRSTGWPVVRKAEDWPPGYGKPAGIFWPPFGDVRTAHRRQAQQFDKVLAEVFRDGGRTVMFDEAAYLSKDLRLERTVRQFYQQGRSVGLTVVGVTQRPVDAPRAMFSECSWFAAFRTHDEDELRRVGEIGGTDPQRIRAAIRSLDPHEFIMVRAFTGEMVRSQVGR